MQSLAIKQMLCKRESYSLIRSQDGIIQCGTDELRYTIVIGTRIDSVIITLWEGKLNKSELKSEIFFFRNHILNKGNLHFLKRGHILEINLIFFRPPSCLETGQLRCNRLHPHWAQKWDCLSFRSPLLWRRKCSYSSWMDHSWLEWRNMPCPSYSCLWWPCPAKLCSY